MSAAAADVFRVALLDDYQDVALHMADWASLAPRAEVTTFTDHLTDIAALAQHGEALGFAYATVPDHILVPRDIASRYPYSDSGEFPGSLSGECMEQIALMSFVLGLNMLADALREQSLKD